MKLNKAEIRSARVDDPSLSHSEIIYQRQLKPNNPHVGKTFADVNMRTLIGGLASVRHVPVYRQKTAAKFKILVEAGQVGGTKAQDYTREIVDNSGIDPELVFIIGDSNRHELKEAYQALGMIRGRVLYQYIVDGVSCASLALTWRRLLEDCKDRKARELMQAYLYDCLDVLAKLWGFKS
ncbi:hypothetical protein MXMO3_01697 [Maritalea myrionectae]|uniref:Uncharacterized protein n=1 Tax=Maritalea myrionectae TaxID=454601 RepID=A0A2R4ME21_9HYPH|nr:hypothetical protein [Maritalea myrionectae]AVX04223.1 hypothetical protein MXMO3_01697 [Maritalea myrionectae]